MTTKQTILEIIEKQLKSKGLCMYKQISSGGLLTSPTFDRRIAYSVQQVNKLSDEGFYVDENMGIFLFNAFTEDE